LDLNVIQVVDLNSNENWELGHPFSLKQEACSKNR